jgi:putative resolvase
VGEGQVSEMVATYADRLTRFGQEYLDCYIAAFGVTLTVLDSGEETSPEQEFTADFLSLIASFSGRLYGIRSAKQKQLVRCAQAVLTSS